jgi:prepilin-type N-terminal cleavage/methylation domain-containing protein
MRRAFTLIELLVVIAIIAILAAILFPVFAQAKFAAKKTTSISGLKQIALGLQIYSNDSDDVSVPDYGYRNQSGGDYYDPTLSTAQSDTDLYHFNNTWVGRTFPYVKSTSIYFDKTLPEISDTKKLYQDPYYPTAYYTYSWAWITTFSLNVDGYSHSYAGTQCGTTGSGGYRSQTSFEEPASLLAATPTRYGSIANWSWVRFQALDASWPTFDAYANTFSWYQLVSDARKQYGNNFIGAFADGHAAKFGPEKFVKSYHNNPSANEANTRADWCTQMTNRNLFKFWGNAYSG